MVVYKGEVVRYVKKAKRGYLQVSLGDMDLWVKKKYLKTVRGKFCEQFPKCAVMKDGKSAKSQPRSNSISAGSNENWVYSRTKRRGRIWYRSVSGGESSWVKRGDFKFSNSCDSGQYDEDEGSGSGSSSATGFLAVGDYKIGVELGYAISQNTSLFQNIIDENPRPASGSTDVNNASYKTPFIESVTGTLGAQVGVYLDYRMMDWLIVRGSGGYRQKSFEVVTKPNPDTTGSVSYDSLDTVIGALDYPALYAGMAVKYPISFGALTVAPGFGVQLDYHMTTHQIEFRSGASKATQEILDTGFAAMEFLILPRLDFHYGDFFIGIETTLSFEPNILVGYSFL